MALDYRGGIAIFQIIFYVPALLCGILLASRHGFGKTAGWYFLIMLSLIRLSGGIFELIAGLHPSEAAYIGAFVCSFIGLSPLTLLVLALLSRVNDHCARQLPGYVFRIIGIVSVIGLVLGIVGANLQIKSSNQEQKNPEIKTAALLFTIIFICVVVIFCILSLRHSQIKSGARRLVLAAGLTLPFLAVRIVAILIGDFSTSLTFSPIFGNVTIYLCMSVLMEVMVATICITVGFTLRIIPKETTSTQHDQETALPDVSIAGEFEDAGKINTQSTVVGAGGRQLGAPKPKHTKKASGPVTWLYYAGKDLYEARRS